MKISSCMCLLTVCLILIASELLSLCVSGPVVLLCFFCVGGIAFCGGMRSLCHHKSCKKSLQSLTYQPSFCAKTLIYNEPRKSDQR
jgi:hypothetical protein